MRPSRKRAPSWAQRQIKQRRQELPRSQWQGPLVLLIMLPVAIAAVVLATPHHPLLEGFLCGFLCAVGIVAVVFIVPITDGSIFLRLYNLHEAAVADVLKSRSGIYSVYSSVEFDSFDVDLVVVAPAGVFALEIKTRTSIERASALGPHYRARWQRQAALGARKVHFLLLSNHLDLEVRPVVVLVGPGTPRQLPVEADSGVLWLSPSSLQTWADGLVVGELGEDRARDIEKALQTYLAQFDPSRRANPRSGAMSSHAMS